MDDPEDPPVVAEHDQLDALRHARDGREEPDGELGPLEEQVDDERPEGHLPEENDA